MDIDSGGSERSRTVQPIALSPALRGEGGVRGRVLLETSDESVARIAKSVLLPPGEGGRRPDEGSLGLIARREAPHPPLRGTFSQGEKGLSGTLESAHPPPSTFAASNFCALKRDEVLLY